jgi:hypothetical protein
MGEEVGTMQFLEFKGEQVKMFKGDQIKKVQKGANNKSKLRCESHVTECMTEKMERMRKRKKEEKKKKKYEYV